MTSLPYKLISTKRYSSGLRNKINTWKNITILILLTFWKNSNMRSKCWDSKKETTKTSSTKSWTKWIPLLGTKTKWITPPIGRTSTLGLMTLTSLIFKSTIPDLMKTQEIDALQFPLAPNNKTLSIDISHPIMMSDKREEILTRTWRVLTEDSRR